MSKNSPAKNQFLVLAALILSAWASSVWALQDAMVIQDKAVIYADQQMTSALGYVSRGKRVKLGDIPRNRAQVYPIMVTGKVGYIRAADVSTQMIGTDSNVLVAERFQKSTAPDYNSRLAAGFYSYSSQVSLTARNGTLKNKDTLNWTGVAIKAEADKISNWEFQLLGNYMTATAGKEKFNVIEVGFGTAYKLIELSHFLLKLQAQATVVPYSTYEYGDAFRKIGYGYGLGTSISSAFRFSTHWGLEFYGGFFYTELTGFNSPRPYSSLSPSFAGTRLGLNVNYQF